jgi:hypothetical protein
MIYEIHHKGRKDTENVSAPRLVAGRQAVRGDATSSLLCTGCALTPACQGGTTTAGCPDKDFETNPCTEEPRGCNPWAWEGADNRYRWEKFGK